MVEFHNFAVSQPFLVKSPSQNLCNSLGFLMFFISASWNVGILVFAVNSWKITENLEIY